MVRSRLSSPRVTPQPVASTSALPSATAVAMARVVLRRLMCTPISRVCGGGPRRSAADDGEDCLWCSSRLGKQWRLWNLWSRSRWWPATLAGQFLVLQLTVLLVVVAVASMVSVQQSDADFRDTRGAEMRAAAESMANIPAVRRPFLRDEVVERRVSLTS